MRFANDLEKYIHYVSQIDYCYWQIKNIADEKNLTVDPITYLINQVTGFDKEQDENKIKGLIYLAGSIIRSKEKLGYDNTNDKKFLSDLKKLKKSFAIT